jgi:hypothetical protein
MKKTASLKISSFLFSAILLCAAAAYGTAKEFPASPVHSLFYQGKALYLGFT